MRCRNVRLAFLAALILTGLSSFSPAAAQAPPGGITPGAPALFHTRDWHAVATSGGNQSGPIIFSPTDNLDPRGACCFPGLVMHKTKVFLIFWSPNNTIAASFKNLLKRFVDDLGGTPFTNINTQYYDNGILGPDFITNEVTFGGTYTDTTTAYTNYNGHTGTASDPISDDDIQQEVDHAISVNSWPTGVGNFFAVFTEKGIESCNGSDCTPGTTNPVYCAYHNWFNLLDNRIYANMPFVNTWPNNCNNTNGTPNNTDADRQVSTFSHELFESITDPFPNATWTETNCAGGVLCGENGDKCIYFFPNPPNSDGSNITLHGNPYNIQSEWSNATFTGAANSGCTYAYKPADMSITKTGPASVFAGGTFSYTVDIATTGDPTAETPHFTDALNANLLFEGVTAPTGWNCTAPAVGVNGNIDCFRTNNALGDDGSLNNGDAASFIVTTRVRPNAANGSTIMNTGTISWDSKYDRMLESLSSVHLSKTSATSATVIASADMEISKAAMGPATAGRDLSYIIDVENDGPSDAQNVSVIDTLPAGTTYVSTTGSGGFTCSGTGPVTCTKSSMGSGAIASITLTVHIAASVLNGANLTNSVTVSSSTSDPNPGNNSASVTVPVNAEADLSISKTGPSAPIAGSDVTYSLNASNSGPSDAQLVHLLDTLPAGTTFVSVTPPAGWTCSGTVTIDCAKSTALPALTSAAFTLVVHLSSSIASGTQLCNTANVTTSTLDPANGNNASTACGTVTTLADLVLTQTATKIGKSGNGTAIFTLTVLNNGPSNSQNIALVMKSDLFTGPPPAINASAGGTCSVAHSSVTCTWSSLAIGASDVVTVSVPWKSAVGDVCNSASVTPGTPDPNAINNVSTVCISKK